MVIRNLSAGVDTLCGLFFGAAANPNSSCRSTLAILSSSSH
jgi:hypothetical protein